MRLLRRLSFTMLLMSMMTLVACGDGDGDLTGGGGAGGDAGDFTISLALSNQNVTGKEPITISSIISGKSAVAGQVVTFSSTLGALSPSSGTALTDSNGLAQIVLTAGSDRGAGEITASLSTGEKASIGFTTQGDDIGVVGDINILLTLVDSDGQTANTISSSKPGKIIAQINGISTPVIVTFTTSVGEIPITTAITNDEHKAVVDILANGSLGAGTIIASINSGETGELLLVVGSSNVIMGSGSPFIGGAADVSLAQVSAGGTSVVSVSIVDDQGNLFNEPVDVNFSSGCVAQSTAILGSPITTSNGIATSTYLAKGCVGDDPINVTASAGGINLSASATINVLAADIGSIEFVSVSPENIGILGTGIVGGSESATAIFRVKDTDGNPYNNRDVNFSLNTNLGGLNLSQNIATTNSQGLVQTVVNSGTVPTTIRITASTETISGEVVFTQSSLLVVSTGLPDQDSFSMAREVANPEAWGVDGVEVPVTVRMADASNNPVPDGTAVNFTTEGGSVGAACTTTNGACSVMWTSQNPRPAGNILTQSFCTLANDNDSAIFCARLPLSNGNNYLGQEYGGRATILATAIGEESFPDKNSNGRFDESEYLLFQGLNVSDRPYDLKEAFVDHNEDNLYNPIEVSTETGGELEEFVDFNSNGVFDIQDAAYNGVLCGFNDITNPGTEIANQYCADPDDEPDPTKKSEKVSTNVRGSVVIVMSDDDPYITLTATNDAIVVGSPNDISTDTSLYISGENTGTVSIVVADFHNQPMPAGTIVSFEATVGSIVGSSSFTWGSDSSNGASSYSVAVKGDKEPKNGLLLIKVEAPGGLTTTFSVIDIIIE